MIIEPMSLQRYDDGQYSKHYYQKSMRVTAGIGNESNALKVVVSDSLKIFIEHCELYESLSSEEAIKNDTAKWFFVSNDINPTFAISMGASHLKVVSTSNTEEGIFEVTGV